jgi:predicted glycogen debranching enzyme
VKQIMAFDLKSWLQKQAGDTTLPLSVITFSQNGMASDLQQIGSQQIELQQIDTREWLITNGLGTYAGSALSGANTRRYHGLLLASLQPPVKRTLLFSRLDESLRVNGRQHNLATNYWQSGAVHPQGYTCLESFSDLPVPTWVFNTEDGRLIKQVIMLRGEQRVYVAYTWLPHDPTSKPAELDLTVLLGYRDFHNQTQGAEDWKFQQSVITTSGGTPANANELTIKFEAFPSATPLYLQGITASGAKYTGQPSWYWNYHWPREFERGLSDREDCFRPGNVVFTLDNGQSAVLSAGLNALSNAELKALNIQSDGSNGLPALVARSAAEKVALLEQAGTSGISHVGESHVSPTPTVEKLTLAADQFVAKRNSTNGSTIIAGYHWFSDWGRDSMISLPGLCLATGRYDEARSILSTFGRYLSEGMLPNYFPDGGQEPEYNTSDATLWWAWALHRYFKATGDSAFVKLQLPLLEEVVAWHVKGTRHGLKLDDDGLITGGDSSVQLTWMDAKVDGYVVTPRSGKAVEINALWYNFLMTVHHLREAVGTTSGADTEHDYLAMAQKCRQGFEQFWLDDKGYLADVIGFDGSIDVSIRPNQLIAASLTYPILSQERATRMLAVVEAELLTPMGLRTLSPAHPSYQGVYGTGKQQADQYHRDITYHQGTVWPWLLGPWVNARIYAEGAGTVNLDFVRERLGAMSHHITNDGAIGSVSEIFDGNAPHAARGCVSQAWSVAELLRVMSEFPQLA